MKSKIFSMVSSEQENVLAITGEITAGGWWDDPADDDDLRDLLRDMKGPLTLRINSPGGDVVVAADMYSALREYAQTRGPITAYVSGQAASAASLIAMAADRVVIGELATIMIHNPWTIAVGNAADMRRIANALEQIQEGMIGVYQRRTGLPRDEVVALLDNETWMSADKAMALGFADARFDGEPEPEKPDRDPDEKPDGDDGDKPERPIRESALSGAQAEAAARRFAASVSVESEDATKRRVMAAWQLKWMTGR